MASQEQKDKAAKLIEEEKKKRAERLKELTGDISGKAGKYWDSLFSTVEKAGKKKKAKKVDPNSKLGKAAKSIRDERDKYRK